MTRHHALGLLLVLTLGLAAGCEQQSIAEQEQIRSRQTLEASTPSITPTPTLTPTAIPSPTLTHTPGPTPTLTPTTPPTDTPVPTPTALPPTATPNPALTNFSLCTQTAGDPAGGRFSARITGITTTVQPAFERLTIGLNVPGDSAPPHAIAHCVGAADDASGSGKYSLLLDLDGWLHDDAFRTSAVSETRALSGTTVLKRLSYRFDPNAASGATLAFELDQPQPFRLSFADKPARFVLEVAKSAAIGPSNDILNQVSGSAKPNAPLFYIQNGDIWSYEGGQATNLTDSPEAETALAFSPAANLLAFCRSAPGAAPNDTLAPGTLWTMQADGSGLVEAADAGYSCADPAFSPDGKTIAFAVADSAATPLRYGIWSVAADGGDAERLTPASDEWSRIGPQWLAEGRLIYAAAAEDGRSTLFVHDADGGELDVGAALLVAGAGSGSTPRFSGFGRPLAAPDGSLIAVEARRVDKPGADLVLLDAKGAEVPTTGDGYWSRPLAWNADGTLFYLETSCASTLAQSYALHARAKSGDDRLIATGDTLGGLGEFSPSGSGLAYVTLAHAPMGPRGPLQVDTSSASSLWFWDVGGSGGRAKLAEANTAIGGLAP
jgi:Tol biopolymer transport system component